ncbi:MAG: hypothetical protein C5B58_03290 [Acidobacteria bacterium]|nr:MAG: hypothetical protein C5B58_03290 [Acidobacteriota bacterium]
MPSGLNIEHGMYIEEPVRTRRDRATAKDIRQQRTRQLSAHTTFRCKWCGSTHTIDPNRETVSRGCTNCGGPR